MSIREFLSRDASIQLSEMKNVTIIVTRRNNKKKPNRRKKKSRLNYRCGAQSLPVTVICTPHGRGSKQVYEISATNQRTALYSASYSAKKVCK